MHLLIADQKTSDMVKIKFRDFCFQSNQDSTDFKMWQDSLPHEKVEKNHCNSKSELVQDNGSNLEKKSKGILRIKKNLVRFLGNSYVKRSIKDTDNAELTVQEQSHRLEWLLLIISTLLMSYGVFLTNIIMEKYIDLSNVKIILPTTNTGADKVSGKIF